MARILQHCVTNINDLESNAATSTLNTITVPLDNEFESTRSFEKSKEEALTRPDKKLDVLATSLPYILKSEDDTCLNLDDSRLLPRLIVNQKQSDTPPPVPAKIVAITNDSFQYTDNPMLRNARSPPHQFLTPPSSPLDVNYIHNEENKYSYDDDDDDDDGENMILSPPPSAKSLTIEFNSFASEGIPGMVHGITNSIGKRGVSGIDLTGSNNSNNNNNNNNNIDGRSTQEQKLPTLPQHQQRSQCSKENSIEDMHTGRSKSLPSLAIETSKHFRPPLASSQSLSSKSTPSSFIAVGTSDSHQMKTSTAKGHIEHADFGMVKAKNQQQSPPNGINSTLHQSPMIPDGTYYPESSLYAASITKPAPCPLSLASHHPRFPPATLQNLNNFRREAQKSPHDPALQLNFAKYLMEAVDQARIDDVTRAIKAKTAMLSEAQRIIKTLAMQSKRGKSGYADAQFYLANAYGAGLMLLKVNHGKAFHLYLQGSKQSHPGCTYRVGVCYELGLGTRRDNARAIRFYRKGANLGDPPAMYKLAIILLRGLLGQGKHPKEAIAWLKKAAPLADAYHPEILHELGLAYEHEGVPSVIPDQDYTRELLTKAARFGYAPSQFKLGTVYENGLWGCPIDARRSIAWYAKAAEQGHLESALALSAWYLTGAKSPDGIIILPQNDVEAYLWAKKVAEAGYAKGQYACGYYFETGIGVEQNLIQAMKWYELAAQQHYVKAITRLEELKQNNTNGTHHQRIKHRMCLSLQTSPSYLTKADNNGAQQQRRHSTSKPSPSATTKARHCHSQHVIEKTAAIPPRSSIGKSSDCQIM